MGKLYHNKKLFNDHTSSIKFITNARFDLELAKTDIISIDKKEICLNELNEITINLF